MVVSTLEEYVKELDQCPIDELHSRLGVFDNYAIFINAELEPVLGYFNSVDDYIHSSSDEDTEVFDVKDKPHIMVRIMKNIALGSLTLSSPKDVERQRRDYNLTIMVNGLNVEDVAIEAKRIGEYLIREKISACLSLANGKELFAVYHNLTEN